MKSTVINTDVLVIGGGLAGCWAAMRAREMGSMVCLIDKGVVGKSGCTSLGGHFQISPAPDDELEAWRREMVEAGEYLNDQEWVDILLREQRDRFNQLVEWGVPFERDSSGNIIRRKGRGHNQTCMSYCDSQGLMKVMRRQVVSSGVDLVERVMITDLLTSDGRHPTKGSVTGAVGFHTRTGDFVTVAARAVIIAAGPMNGLKDKGQAASECTGDGPMMAFRAGAEVTGMEFGITAYPLFYDGKHRYGMLDTLTPAAGVRLVNAPGEKFMERYDPVLLDRARWSVLCRAIAKENLEGRGPIRVDSAGFREQDKQLLEKYRYAPPEKAYEENKEMGLARVRQTIPCVVRILAGSVCGEAGIRIDTDGSTNIPGLFAAGSACYNWAHGTYSVSGVNLAFCNVGGYRAGKSAAEYQQKNGKPNMDSGQAKSLKQAAFLPLRRKQGPSPTEIYDKIRDDILSPAGVSIFRNEERIRAATKQLDRVIEKDLPRIAAADVHELVKANEVKNAALMCKLTLLAALERRETRGWSYREEYPYRDDADWLKWIVLRREDGRIKVSYEPVPIERYPLKLGERKQVPATVQFSFKDVKPSGAVKEIDRNLCDNCGICIESCPLDVLRVDEAGNVSVAYPGDCVGTACYLCRADCPRQAITVSAEIGKVRLPF